MNAIICDLQGTLFNCQWRREKYLPDYDKFNKNHIFDKVKEPILKILQNFQDSYKLIFISSREGKYLQTVIKR